MYDLNALLIELLRGNTWIHSIFVNMKISLKLEFFSSFFTKAIY